MKYNFIKRVTVTYKIIIILFFCFILLIASIMQGCTTHEVKKPSDEITVQLKWVHQAQFAGLYVAEQKGYYSDENINVKFIEGGQGIDLVEPLLNGQADFSIMSPEVLITERSKGTPIKAIASIYRRSAVVFVSMKDSGIARPENFLKKSVATLGQPDFEILFGALCNKLGLDIQQITLKNYDPEYIGFYNQDIDVTAAYLTGGVIRIEDDGYNLNIIWPGDYAINFYSDTVVTTEDMIENKPELVMRFLSATLRGWKDAVGDAGSAVEAILEYAQVKDVNLQTKMMDAQAPLIHTGEDNIGWMKDNDWKSMYEIMLEQNLIDSPLDYKNLYTVDFLKNVYEANTK